MMTRDSIGTERSVFARCARRIVPLLAGIILLNYIDRANVGFAALTMNRDLGFSPSQYGFGAGIFFLGYSVLQVPISLIIHQVGERRGLFWIMIAWGLFSSACAFVRSPFEFYILRFLLGAAEAAFFPVIMMCLIRWFPLNYRGRYTAACQSAAQLAFVIGGPLSGLLLGMDGQAGLRGWQWLFLIEGVPTLIWAVVVYFTLTDEPARARWLSDSDKQIIIAAHKADGPVMQHRIGSALGDWRIYVLGIALFGVSTGDYGLIFWWPQMVQAMGFSNLASSLVVALAYLASIPVAIAWARHSDMHGERRWHIALAALLAAFGLIAASVVPDFRLRLVALTIATAGTLTARPPMNNLPAMFLGGAGAAAGIALYNSIGNSGGFAGPYIIGLLKEHTGSYDMAMAALALGPVISAFIVLLICARLSGRPVLADEFSEATSSTALRRSPGNVGVKP
jgi:ACS family tartrate transporter-like MFS transporter